MILKDYLIDVVWNSSLWEKIEPECVVRYHENLVSLFSTSPFTSFLVNTIPIIVCVCGLFHSVGLYGLYLLFEIVLC